MSNKLQWGIIGAGGIAGAFAHGVNHSKLCELRAVSSRSQEKADKFADEHNIPNRHGSYEAMLADDEVQAIYIATPHPMHAEWIIKCAEAGKHILCEKPITLNRHDTMAVIEHARRNDVFLMEAFMYRCHPQTIKLVELLREKVIGEVRIIRATFGFHAGFNPEGRLFKNALGGGGILDVGCYATSVSRLIAGVALGGEIAEPINVQGAGRIGESNVDDWAVGTLTFPNDIVAQISTSVQLNQDNKVTIFGSEGNLVIDSPWFCSGREGGSSKLIVNKNKGGTEEVIVQTDEWLYGIEADHVAKNIENRQGQFPAMTWADTLGNATTLDKWRQAVGLVYDAEKDENLTMPIYGRSLKRRKDHKMKYGRVKGIEKDISKVVMGCDNQGTLMHGTAMWDDFFELGGTCFDTAYIYGGGRPEVMLGQWMKNRNNRDNIVLISKGAHSPHCFPDKIVTQHQESLERLQTDYVDLYFMHRDNLQVPIGEFVDVLNELKDKGSIKVFGGSNWTMERVKAANEYAVASGKQGFGAVSNNFSLARMVDAPWGGCLAASNPEYRAYLNEVQMPLFPWSSQARGFFVPGRAAPDKTEDQELVRCWYSDDNFERQKRAIAMADKLGVDPISIALAYVINQPFPCFPLFGPRVMSETTSSLKGLSVELSPDDLKYLNLED
ncbi:MAG: aldo/keto reductase [Planctomycetota bacterium]|nr:aldo/keto reductase [Planctomycetota bacterium]MDA1138271.1 aldo/keto reductase [Planctomycetota bacterium]